MKNFIWKNNITRFGIPMAIKADNGTQFDNKLIKSFCAKYKMKNYYSTPLQVSFRVIVRQKHLIRLS